MICLDKADKAAFRHLTWNQSPPALAAGHTTRQDLNGISNLREYVAAGQDGVDGGGGSTSLGIGADSDEEAGRQQQPRRPVSAAPDAGRWFSESPSCLKTVRGGDGHVRPLRMPSSWVCPERLWSWIFWIASVLVFSYLLSSFKMLGLSSLTPDPHVSNVSTMAANSYDAMPSLKRLDIAHIADHSLTKRGTCQIGGVNAANYDMPLHVGALLIIWVVSSLGCAFPIVAAKFPGLRIPRRFFFAVRHFGTGVLIATAFVHLLPTAFVSLGNPCLGDFWTKQYQAMPGAIALAAIFLVSIIEMILHPSRRITPSKGDSSGNGKSSGPSSGGHLCSSTAMLPFRDMGPLSGRASSLAQGLSQLNHSSAIDGEATTFEAGGGGDVEKHPNSRTEPEAVDQDGESHQEQRLSPEMRRRKERLQCILLEMGILFHSIFIGMALSVSVGADFIVLLIAIVFHQTFEGLALGARIAAIEWESLTWQPWAMAIAYGCTTPIGQAIGLATHTLYSPDSEIGLIVVGVMNAISAGLLTFASLIELLSEDFLSDESWRVLRGKSRVMACILVFFGAFFMSLVGAWA
ncbi:hypothetical protein HIM_08992 [Hirsutella minnesotensis 3608]|uniref:Zinc-regulated transporter 2 n=1 Tax=Hirsutella minnesotensis 3608 TaxID=1043627 RepID=A0A0F7ZSM0_9HYPO|nr:hypothetical protein HIM_08992 [Hirsutella minnesotensis 3608]